MVIPETPLLISAIQHFSYCPRQFALIHLEQAWAENRFTTEGQLLHQRVDSGISEQRSNIRFERGVCISSSRYLITGKMDLLEITLDAQPEYTPVEYKRGKPKTEDWDRIQLCTQALCIEEMREVTVKKGAIWYWETRRREQVVIDDTLRQTTISAIEQAHNILTSGYTPPPTVQASRCRACSLHELCEPEIFRNDHSSEYVETLFKP